MANKPVGLTLAQIANDAKATSSFVTTTINAYKKVAVSLHQAACIVFWHVAEGNDPKPLNDFYNGLRVNDQTALRVWFGQHTAFVDLANNTTRNWIKFSDKDKFTLVKGCEAHRKDMFTVGEVVEGRQDLLALKPFYEKNVKDKDAITLEALMNMLLKAAEGVTKKAGDEGIALDADTINITTSVKNFASKRIAELKAVAE